MKKIILSFLLVLFAFALVGCTKDEPTKEKTKEPTIPGEIKTEEPTSVVPATIDYDLTEKTLKVGETFVIEVADNIGFINGNNKVISLDKDTKTVKALAAGEAEVTLYLKDNSSVKLTIKFTVEEEKEPTPVKQEYTIAYDLDGGVATGLVEKFLENEFPVLATPTKEGFDFIGWFDGETLVTAINENKNYNLKASWNATVLAPTSIEITLSNEQDVYYLDTPLVISAKVLPEGANQEFTWKAMNKSKATINEDGTINILHGDEATFKAISVEDEEVYASITIKIKPYLNPTDFINGLAVDTDNIVAKKIKQYTSNAGDNAYIIGSVFKYLFENLSIIENMCPVGQSNRPGKTCSGNPFSLLYVCVHDVGAPGDAKSNSNYCKGGSAEVSWHFTVGNDGVYQQLPMDEVGWHAGDGTGTPLTWHDSGILAPEGDDTPATITINQTSGKFMVNGVESNVVAPKNGSGQICKDSDLPYTGINNYVDMDKNSPTYRHYFIGDCWWSSSFKTLSNRGGNLNSIGIESQVTGNTFYTWELMAKLIGKHILPNTGLLLRDIKQHNTFSGKDCPMTMRHAGMWETFLDYVTAEYLMATQFYSFKIEFSTTSPYLKGNGMIKSLPDSPTEASYSIRFYSTTEGYDQTFNYTVTLPAKSVITY